MFNIKMKDDTILINCVVSGDEKLFINKVRNKETGKMVIANNVLESAIKIEDIKSIHKVIL